MAANSFRPPKPRELTENETITSYAKWQSNVLFLLSQCNDFAPFLETEWEKDNVAQRGFTDDASTETSIESLIQSFQQSLGYTMITADLYALMSTLDLLNLHQ